MRADNPAVWQNALYSARRRLIALFLEVFEQAPKQIWLDLDATDGPLYSNQQRPLFHGYDGHRCDLPLYIFCAKHLLRARLRESNIDGAVIAQPTGLNATDRKKRY